MFTNKINSTCNKNLPIQIEAGEIFALSEKIGTPLSYNARELTVKTGQELTIEHEESGWYWCRDQQGERGWVPISHVAAQA